MEWVDVPRGSERNSDLDSETERQRDRYKGRRGIRAVGACVHR